MPEQPHPPKRRPVAPLHSGDLRPPARHLGSPYYAELFCRTNYSFLEGASHPDELVTRASELGYAALAVTDRNSLAGVVRAHVAAKAAGLKLLIGAMLTPEDSSPLLVWAPDRPAYGRLARMITHGRRAAPKGECYLRFADVASYAQGLLAGVLLTEATGPDLARYRDLFGDGCYAIATLACGPHDRRRLREMAERAAVAGVPMLAANDVHYHSPRRRPLHDVLTAIRHGCTVAELGHRGFGNAQRHLIKPADMLALFADCPDAVTRTVEVADRCRFNLDELRYDYPEELCPAGLTPGEYLAQLTWAGAKRRYPTGIPDKVRRLIEHELTLIGELHYEAYFLTVWDLVRFARSRDILCQGRGSAANSAVCYCLGVTAVDPDRIDVLFERFVSKERNEAPDIDVDFEHERREEVLQYIYDKYGRERAGMTAEVITYRERSAVREVGKALGLSPDRADRLAKTMDHHPRRDEDRLASRVGETGLNPGGRLGRQLIALVQQLIGFPRHLSQHVGGMVLTHRPLCELVPIENAAMPGRTVIQWDKDDLDALGILKVDCLSLGMLTAIRKCFHLVGPDKAGEILTLATIPPEDHIVYDMVCRADTIGVFQIESRAQMAMLPRLRPRCFYDLVIEVAIVRPGPIQGKMVHPYLRRRRGDEPIDYPNEAIRAVLEKTMGVPIFQEQAMRLAVVGAGFTPGEADQLRRAMGAWRRRGVMEPFREKLIRGMQANGLTVDFAERVYQQICGFGEYGFPESHAASFALLVYVSAWLKCYYPAAFTAAILNSLPMGFYAPAQLVADARKHGVEIRPIDVNHSHWDCTLESVGDRAPALRLGFRLVTGLHQSHADQIVTARACGAFRSFAEFVRRTGLRGGALRRLSRADVFRSLPLGRREAFWRALPERDPPNLFDNVEPDATPAPLPAMTSFEEVLADYTTTSLSLRQHPISFLRPYLKQLGATPAGQLPELPHERQVTVAGLVLLRQRPSTANGITFVTLEDETGMVNLIVRQVVWERYRNVARAATALLAHGEIQRDPNVIHVLVTKLEDMTSRLAELRTHSRDFH